MQKRIYAAAPVVSHYVRFLPRRQNPAPKFRPCRASSLEICTNVARSSLPLAVTRSRYRDLVTALFFFLNQNPLTTHIHSAQLPQKWWKPSNNFDSCGRSPRELLKCKIRRLLTLSAGLKLWWGKKKKRKKGRQVRAKWEGKMFGARWGIIWFTSENLQ